MFRKQAACALCRTFQWTSDKTEASIWGFHLLPPLAVMRALIDGCLELIVCPAWSFSHTLTEVGVVNTVHYSSILLFSCGFLFIYLCFILLFVLFVRYPMPFYNLLSDVIFFSNIPRLEKQVVPITYYDISWQSICMSAVTPKDDFCFIGECT